MAIIVSWIIVAALARLLERTWWAPGSFLALTLGVSATGTILLAPEYYMSLAPNLYLQVFVIVTSVASAIGQNFALVPSTAISRQDLMITAKGPFLIYGLLASSLSAYYTFQTAGIAVGALASPLGVMRAAQRVTYDRYTEGLDFPIFYNISNALLLAYAMAAAVHFTAKGRIEYKLLVPILIYSATSVITTARGPILMMLLLMVLAAVFTTKLTSESGRFISLGHPTVVKIAVGLALFVSGVFVLFQVLRFGESSGRSLADIWSYLRRWPWGSLPGFSLWFDGHSGAQIDSIPGYYTFMGLYDNLGLASRQQGAYTDYVELARGEPANIYTAFRGLYHDFGLIGSGLFLSVLGFVGGLVIQSRALGPYVSISIYVAVLAFIAYTPVISTWAYTSNIAALIMLPLVLKLFVAPSRLDARTKIGRPSRNA